MMNSVTDKLQSVRHASRAVSALSCEEKDTVIKAVAKKIDHSRDAILSENQKDVELAKKAKMSKAGLHLLELTQNKINDLLYGMQELASMEDPIHQTLKSVELNEGLELYCVSYPLGVIGVVFENIPEVLIQVCLLCLKSGNAVIFKGGKESMHTQHILFSLVQEASEECKVTKEWVALVDAKQDLKKLLDQQEHLDLLITRVSQKTTKLISDRAKIPVLHQGRGLCHVYVDDECDVDMAVKVCYDSKCQNPAAGNALETLVVHKAIAATFLPRLRDMLSMANVRLLGDDAVLKVLGIEHATHKDWGAEYNDLVLSITIVESIDDAIGHINQYSSKHTDGIVTKDKHKAKKFMQHVDSASVLWNCSTLFSDGYRYGLGGDAVVSTGKFHARGPVGMEGLVTYKWKVIGNGNLVSDYYVEEPKKFTHKMIDKRYPLE